AALFLFRFGIGRRLGGRRRRLGAGIDEHRFALLLQRGGALRLGGAQARQENSVGRLGIVVGDHVVLVLGRRPLAVTAAHFVAQLGRRGSDRVQGFHRAELRREPAPRAIA